MQTHNKDFPSFSSSESPFHSNKPSTSNIAIDNQRKMSDNTITPKTNQTLKFDTSQIKCFVDKTKIANFQPSKTKIFRETSKLKSKQSVKGCELEKITEKFSEKLSEKHSSSKSSYSKQHSQDSKGSKEESKTLDQANLKDNDFSKKKAPINPLENLDMVLNNYEALI